MLQTEKQLEDFLFNGLYKCPEELESRGLLLDSFDYSGAKKIWLRQLNIDPYGIIDIIGFYRFMGRIHADILELKITDASIDHIEQVFRYRRGVERYLENTFGEFGNISCYVICKSYDGFYTQNFSPINFITYSFDWITGVQFNYQQGYSSWHMKSDLDKSFRNRKKVIPDLSKIYNGQKID